MVFNFSQFQWNFWRTWCSVWLLINFQRFDWIFIPCIDFWWFFWICHIFGISWTRWNLWIFHLNACKFKFKKIKKFKELKEFKEFKEYEIFKTNFKILDNSWKFQTIQWNTEKPKFKHIQIHQNWWIFTQNKENQIKNKKCKIKNANW